MAIEKIIIERNKRKDMIKLTVKKPEQEDEELLYIGHVNVLDVDEFIDTVKLLFQALYE